MTKSFRVYNNYTLAEAINFAKTNSLSLNIYIVEPYELNEVNKKYFIENTRDLSDKLLEYSKNVQWINRNQDLSTIIRDNNAIFIDKAYLRFDIEYYGIIKEMALKHQVNLFTIEGNVFVPVRMASDKEEYSARTIRPKINKLLSEYREEVLIEAKKSIGENLAFKTLDDFIDNKLDKYDLHNDPSLELTSNLSPYLKYGFISPVSIYNRMAKIKGENKDSFLEELIVRRELAYNFVYYNPTYDEFKYMTYDWAYMTMEKHLKDEREYLYTKEDYLSFKTHDPYFNAAMKEMVYLGKMHSYMRMYWCKKIIEWSKTYEEAFKTAIELNNYYFTDGLTPNGYCGVAWCFGKHDRAWTERDIFGKLRYMNANGLKRKFAIDDYVEKMNKIEKENR
ncbi:MAG: deoxyribodipyrimidine photo-lyase [Candidatus Izemoplasmatales bacterium]